MHELERYPSTVKETTMAEVRQLDTPALQQAVAGFLYDEIAGEPTVCIIIVETANRFARDLIVQETGHCRQSARRARNDDDARCCSAPEPSG
jgi:hypothetical protein